MMRCLDLFGNNFLHFNLKPDERDNLVLLNCTFHAGHRKPRITRIVTIVEISLW